MLRSTSIGVICVIAYVPEAREDLQCQIDKIDEIDNSFETAYDKQEPRLLLCNQCEKEYDIPSWIK